MSASAKPPFRLHVPGDTPEPLVIDEIRQLTDLADDETMATYALHPDERVPLAYLEFVRGNLGNRSQVAPDVFYQRAVGDARREGVAWTRLLDALACSDGWARKTTQPGAAFTPDDVVWSLPKNWSRPVERFVPLEEQIAPIAEWIPNADPGEVAQLLDYKVTPIWRLVARHVRAFDRDLLQRLVERPTLLPDILSNPALTAADREMLSWWATAVACEVSVAPGAPEGSLVNENVSPAAVENYVNGLAASVEMQRLLVPLILRMPTSGPDQHRRRGGGLVARILIMHPKTVLSPETEELLADHWKHSLENLTCLVGHPSAGAITFDVAATQAKNTNIRDTLRGRRAARARPLVRKAFRSWIEEHAHERQSRADVAALLLALTLEAGREELHSLWPRLVERNPGFALDVLLEGAAETVAALEIVDILRLLGELANHASPLWLREALRAVAERDLAGVPGSGVEWLTGEGRQWIVFLVKNAPAEAVELFGLVPATLASFTRNDLRPMLMPPASAAVRRAATHLIANLPIARDHGEPTPATESTPSIARSPKPPARGRRL